MIQIGLVLLAGAILVIGWFALRRSSGPDKVDHTTKKNL